VIKMSEARVFEGVAPDIKVTERYAEENYRGFIRGARLF